MFAFSNLVSRGKWRLFLKGCLLSEGQKWVVLTCGFCMFRLLLIAKLCLICVCGLNHFLWLICLPSSHCSPPLVPSFHATSSLCSCIMWSGWTCIVIRPYGGGRVSESAWRWLDNSKQSFPSMGTPLGQTTFKYGSVLSLTEGWL